MQEDGRSSSILRACPAPSLIAQASFPLRDRLPAAGKAAPHCRPCQFELAPQVGAIGKEGGDRRLRVSSMPGEGGAYGIVLVGVPVDLGFVLGKRSHVCILL